MDFCGPSLSSCSSTRSTPDTSVSLTPGHSPLFSWNQNVSFQVSYLIFLHVTITLILYLITMSHLSIINVYISRCNLLMWRIPVHYSLQRRCHVNNFLPESDVLLHSPGSICNHQLDRNGKWPQSRYRNGCNCLKL